MNDSNTSATKYGKCVCETRPPWIWSQSSFPTRSELQPQKRKNKKKFWEIKRNKSHSSRVVFCVKGRETAEH